MGFLSLLAIAVALAMDAFAVAISAGLVLRPITPRPVFRLAFHFGLFQALMPIAGWLLGRAVHSYIAAADHWVAFAVLAIVGGHMIWNAQGNPTEKRALSDPSTGLTLVALSIATSIDALAVGLSLAMLGARILLPAAVIGGVAAIFTIAGMVLGDRIGSLWQKRAEIAGGVILMLIGVRILIDHLRG